MKLKDMHIRNAKPKEKQYKLSDGEAARIDANYEPQKKALVQISKELA